MLKQKQRKSLASQYRKRSPLGDFWYRFSQNKGAVVGLVIVVALIFVALFADVFFDYEQDICGYIIKDKNQAPNAKYLFGTDSMGRNLFSRVLYGTKYSLSIGASVLLFTFCVGLPAGAICGYYGGKVDLFIMRIFNIIGSIPGLLLGIIVVSAFGQDIWVLVLALGISRIGGVAGITRTAVMTVRSAEYLESARAIGMKDLRIIFSHVLPNCLAPIIVDATLGLGGAIIACSSLSFLGLGVPIPTPEWGALLSDGRSQIRMYPYMTVFPGLAIMITVLALNLVGDGLRDALDPKMKK